ncbi:MAG: pantoate--beta-alanine ligase [Rudaea sp.]
MQTVQRSEDLRATIAKWRASGQRVGFVPTMGNLHNGHFSLISIARANADRVVASVFVNPTQFGPHEDFASYPRTLAQDESGLDRAGCELLFAPSVDEMYPFGAANMVRIDVPGLSETLDGALRPGHFSGVATVVAKLFNLVAPDVAVFGQKDFQQLLVIRRLVADLRLPIAIIGAPIVRESNGLAMSSRNQYLTADERERAAVIFRTLETMRHAAAAGQPISAIENAARMALEEAGLVPDYAVIKRSDNLASPSPDDRALVALIAARLGRARLIDNLAFDV